MISYDYRCSNCEHEMLNVMQSIKDKPKVRCPSCKKHKLARVIKAPYGIVKGNITTIGQLADANTKKMGKEQVQIAEDKAKAESQKAHSIHTDGADYEAPEGKPWYKDGKNDLTMGDYTSMDQSRLERFVQTGKK